MKRTFVLVLLILCALPSLAQERAGEPVDLSMMTRIRDEGLHRSQVMDTLYHLTDVIGARLTGSPQLKAANDWTRDQLKAWGLANAHLEGYPFGRGWSFSSCQVRMVAPRTAVLLALPKAWTPGTNGPVHGEVVHIKAETPQDLDAYRGKVAGKILLLDEAREFKPFGETKAAFDPSSFGEEPERYSREDLERIAAFEYRDRDPAARRAAVGASFAGTEHGTDAPVLLLLEHLVARPVSPPQAPAIAGWRTTFVHPSSRLSKCS